jgi:membrane protein DedA with SNARE-associated domain
MLLHTVTHFIMQASPLLICLIVAVALGLESCGVPIVNTTLLLLTGALASMGHVSLWVLAIAAIAGSSAGACLAYFIGKVGGRRALLRLALFFHIDRHRIKAAEDWFQKSGAWMIFLSRMLPYVRPFACFPAGISQMNFTRFLLAALAGSTIWCLAILAVGWNLGRRWGLAVHMIRVYTLPAIAVTILLVAIVIAVSYIIKKGRGSHAQPSGGADDEAAHESRDLMHV